MRINSVGNSAAFGARFRIYGSTQGLTENELSKLTEKAAQIGTAQDMITIALSKPIIEPLYNSYHRSIAAFDTFNTNSRANAHSILSPANNNVEQLKKPFPVIDNFLDTLKSAVDNISRH